MSYADRRRKRSLGKVSHRESLWDFGRGSCSHWTLAANRLYYAAYYASKALLIQNGIVAKSHEGVIGMIGQNFVVTGIISKDDAKLLARLQNMRKTGDYDDFIEWHQDDVEPLFQLVEEYINKIKGLVELN